MTDRDFVTEHGKGWDDPSADPVQDIRDVLQANFDAWPGPVVPRKVVAYCKKGAACGNPYMGGKFYYTEGFFVDGCPRCDGPITHNPEYVR